MVCSNGHFSVDPRNELGSDDNNFGVWFRSFFCGAISDDQQGGREGGVGKWMNPAATSSWSHPRSGWCETASARVPPLTLVPAFPGGLALWLAIYWSSGFKKPSSVMIGRFNLIQTFPMFAFAFISIFHAHFVILCSTREHSGI